MDGNGFEVDVMCVRTVYTLKLFCDAILFFAYIGLNGFASCSSKLCLCLYFIIIIFKIFRSFNLLYICFSQMKRAACSLDC